MTEIHSFCHCQIPPRCQPTRGQQLKGNTKGLRYVRPQRRQVEAWLPQGHRSWCYWEHRHKHPSPLPWYTSDLNHPRLAFYVLPSQKEIMSTLTGPLHMEHLHGYLFRKEKVKGSPIILKFVVLCTKNMQPQSQALGVWPHDTWWFKVWCLGKSTRLVVPILVELGEEQVFETGCTGGYGGKSTFEAVRGGTNHYSIYSTWFWRLSNIQPQNVWVWASACITGNLKSEHRVWLQKRFVQILMVTMGSITTFLNSRLHTDLTAHSLQQFSHTYSKFHVLDFKASPHLHLIGSALKLAHSKFINKKTKFTKLLKGREHAAVEIRF